MGWRKYPTFFSDRLTSPKSMSSNFCHVLKAKSLNSLADTSKEEQKIDLLVYKLYGLTYDEVLIVDPQTPISREEYEKIKS